MHRNVVRKFLSKERVNFKISCAFVIDYYPNHGDKTNCSKATVYPFFK